MQEATLRLSPLSHYSFGVKDAQQEQDATVAQKINRLKTEYQEQGQRTTVEAVMLVHDHKHPHVLVLRNQNYFHLPGDQLKPGEDDINGLKAILTRQLGAPGEDLNLDIGQLLGKYYRPHFDTQWFPYLPPHIKKPKEVRQIYLVHLPDRKYLCIPKNLQLVAVPLFDLVENAVTFGPELAHLPQLLSRYHIFYGEDD
ncbi:Cleavage/polyadenylation specificity factor subunit 5 [Gorgonomyces haynaldii]|nr:Cleavage/polyadenylation specificity factor subunit 5 [Gorgonomyces haynaldii]